MVHLPITKGLLGLQTLLAPIDYQVYSSVTGALQYLMLTRLHLTFVVNQVCQHMHNPSPEHFIALKRILWYIKGTIMFGINITRILI